VAKFREAVKNSYYFQMYYDDLPLWGFIGKVEKESKIDPKYSLFTHLHFDIKFNKDRVIEISVRTDPSFTVDITEDKEVEIEFV
jgi:hypothetical protein